jgi:hypothetical protein
VSELTIPVSVPNHSGRGSRFVRLFLMTQPFKKASAWWTDEVEQRHPNEEQGDDGDGNDDSNGFIGHRIVSETHSRGV